MKNPASSTEREPAQAPADAYSRFVAWAKPFVWSSEPNAMTLAWKAYQAGRERELAAQAPVAWTLRETLAKRETTTRAHLWFSDPVNSGWVPLYAAAPSPATGADLEAAAPGASSESLGVPASPSGSTLQSPSSISAAIPNANTARTKFDPILGVSTAAAYQATQHEYGRIDRAVARLTAIRDEQIERGVLPCAGPIEPPDEAATLSGAPLDAYSPEDRAFFAFWYGHMRDDLMQPPLAGVRHSTARYIWDAARGIVSPEGIETRSGSTAKPQEPGPQGAPKDNPGAASPASRPDPLEVPPGGER